MELATGLHFFFFMRQIRKSTTDDIPALLEIVDEARQTMRESGNLKQWTDGYPSADVFLQDIGQGVSYVVEQDGQVVATFALIPGPDITYATIYEGQWLNDESYYVIHRIASRHGVKGVLHSVVDYAFQWTQNIRIDTHRDNVIMQHLLQKYDFRYCGIIYLLSGDERLAYQRENEHKNKNKMKEIYLAGGCFWGTEHYFKQVKGVISTEVGFANGHTADPTYKEVYTDQTGYAETVHVVYDEQQVGLEFLLNMFFKAIDPTSLNRQGHDEGTRYRTGVYYVSEDQLPIINKVFDEQQALLSAPIVVERCPLSNFYTAEEYHQDYLDKNPEGYCHLPTALFEFARQAKDSTRS